MYNIFKILGICLLFFSILPYVKASEKKQALVTELQVLIDVSGSMKQNDPHNLRVPALKLLINLLPNGTKAGILLFAEKTKVLVETGEVNAAWKKKALFKVREIHSSGLFTDIEDAIQTASQSWFDSKDQQNRHLILLTDGMVDVSKDIMQSAESRDRVLVDQIPLLQQAGVKVQSIALSNHADAELLNKLAFNTNGWSETAETADQLQKVFFKIFKKAVPQDSVPINGNAFVIDNAVKEFSLLIFKEKGAQQTRLIAPNNKKIIATKKIKNVTWLNESSYDLITIKKPKAGTWQIVAKMDADNQVMIVTDLKLQVDELSSHILEKESFEIMAYFTDKQELISRKDFLSLIEISIEHTDTLGNTKQWKMNPVVGKEGLFKGSIGAGLVKGKHKLKLIADGKTFQREYEKTVEVVENLIRIETEVNKAERTLKIKLIPDEMLVNTKMMVAQLEISQIGKSSETHEMNKKGNSWEYVVSAAAQGESKVVNFSIMAKTMVGVSITPDIKPIVIEGSLFAVEEVIEKDVEVKKEDEKKTEPIEIDEEDIEPIIEAEPANWGVISAIVVGVNIVLIVAGFFLFKLMKNKNKEKQEQLLGRLG